MMSDDKPAFKVQVQIFSWCPRTLLDGTNVRLNWNIESDMNVYNVYMNFLVYTDLRINSTEFSHILHHK
jgi:hypothetical protein